MMSVIRGRHLALVVTMCITHVIDAESRQTRTIKIGGLFESEFLGQQRAFRSAIENINSRGDILPNIKLTFDVQNPRPHDSFSASKKVCRQVRDGLAAVFGPMSANSAAHVRSVTYALGIPHIATRWSVSESDDDGISINLFPHYVNLSQAYVDVLGRWQWTDFTILYETDEGLLRLQELMKASANNKFRIKIRKLEPEASALKRGRHDYRPVLKELRLQGASRIVLDCSWNKVQTVLHQAMTINMTTYHYHYMLTTLDAELVDLEDFQYGGVNVTAFRLVDSDNPYVREITNGWRYEQGLKRSSPLENDRGFRTETALMYDAVQVFAAALHEMDTATVVETEELSCTKAKAWDSGETCHNFMIMARVHGLSGPVRFDRKGHRTHFKLDLIELTSTGLDKVGEWEPVTGLNITKSYSMSREDVADDLKNKTLRITSISEAPYMMWKEDPEGLLTGNDRFEGYCVDLLSMIATRLHFNYTIQMVEDGQYGSRTGANNEWTGMVRELMDLKADLAVASLTISWVREQVVDFTKPFMNLGISIIFKRPENKNPSLFSFLSPLSFEIWIYMLAAYLVVSFTMFVLARFSPYEWQNPHPCNPESDVVENQFTLMNSLWFTIGSLMQQGSELAPKAMSTRLVSGIWWFFTLIMISSYTANLAAFLTVERMASPIEDADDLSKQTDIKYGTIFGGSTMTFFKESTIDTFQRMWNFMESDPSVFVNKTEEGIERVKKGDYAFLLESTMNEYTTQRQCELMSVGQLLDSKGYGIGTPRGSPYRDILSDVILKLQEEQELQILYNKWWKEKGGAGQCVEDDKAKKDANALAIANVGGVFVVLVGGLVLSLIVAMLEFVWKARKHAESERQPVCTEMAEEFRFALQCFGSSSKPSARPKPDLDLPGNGMSLMRLDGYHTPRPHAMPVKEIYS